MTDHKLTLQKRDALQVAFNTQGENTFAAAGYLALHDALALIADLQQRVATLEAAAKPAPDQATVTIDKAVAELRDAQDYLAADCPDTAHLCVNTAVRLLTGEQK